MKHFRRLFCLLLAVLLCTLPVTQGLAYTTISFNGYMVILTDEEESLLEVDDIINNYRVYWRDHIWDGDYDDFATWFEYTYRDGIPGDVNGDGIIDLDDVLRIYKTAFQQDEVSADLNKDSVTNLKDAVQALEIVVGKQAQPAVTPRPTSRPTATPKPTPVPTSTPATDYSSVYNTMIALQSQYPEGMHWTNADFYAWRGGGMYYGGYGCVAFAYILSDAAFGSLPSRMYQDVDAIRVGDILRINNDSHSVIVLEVYDDYVVVAEGNYNSSIHWGRQISKDTLRRTMNYAQTRYPN